MNRAIIRYAKSSTPRTYLGKEDSYSLLRVLNNDIVGCIGVTLHYSTQATSREYRVERTTTVLY